MELKSQPKGIGRAVALLSARFALDALTEGFDRWDSHAEDVWGQITGIDTTGDDADAEEPEDEAEDPLRASVTAMIERAAFGLLYALAEERVSWETWRGAATIAEHAAPLYEALETLGYRTSDTETEALNGSLAPIDDDDNGGDAGIGQDGEPDDGGTSQTDDASGKPEDAE